MGVPVYGSTSTSTANSGTFAGGAGATATGSLTDTLNTIVAELNKDVQSGTFQSDYKISSSDMTTYYGSSGFTLAAASLVYYAQMSESERQSVQEQMVTAGVLPASEATGQMFGSPLTAFENLAGRVALTGSDPFTYLDQNATPEAAIQNQISGNLAVAEKAAQAPEEITQANPTTLSAAITAAFMQTTGRAPDQAQIQAFISGVEGQYDTYGNAPRAAAQAEITQAHNEESALNALGPDGVDKVISAYQQAVSGSGLAGAGTTQGPVTGPSMANSPLGHTFMGGSNEVGPNVQPVGTTRTTTKMVPQGILGQFVHSLEAGVGPGAAGTPYVPQKTTSTTYRAPNLGQNAPAGVTWAGSTHGGTYALSQADWTAAQKDYAPAKKYATPGAAPQAVQQAAFTALLTNLYESNGNSWSKAVASIASGTPFGTKEGSNLAAFGDQVAAQVNASIAALQNEVDNSPVTVKVAAPDVTAEANLAAKQANPVGYYAANVGSWDDVLSGMLQGSPELYNQSASDTFTGPVNAAAMTGSGSTVG